MKFKLLPIEAPKNLIEAMAALSMPPLLANMRAAGTAQGLISMPPPIADVRAAGSFKRYANAPRLDVVVLQALCAKGRASPPPVLERLFPTSTKSLHLPKEIFWRILSFWRTDRDP